MPAPTNVGPAQRIPGNQFEKLAPVLVRAGPASKDLRRLVPIIDDEQALDRMLGNALRDQFMVPCAYVPPDDLPGAVQHIEAIAIPNPPTEQMRDILGRSALRLAPAIPCPAIPRNLVPRRVKPILLPMGPIKIDAVSLPKLLSSRQVLPLSS